MQTEQTKSKRLHDTVPKRSSNKGKGKANLGNYGILETHLRYFKYNLNFIYQSFK